MSFFAELKRRNVFRVGIAYAVATWVLLQVMDIITPILDLPEWAPKLIFVLLAVGLVPALILAWAFELTPEGLKKEKDVDRSASITNVTGRKLDYAIIAALLVAVGMLVADRYAVDPEPAVAASVTKSIAVLPFVNMSSDPEQEFFSDGITEEILNALASVKELKVAGRTSSFAFKGRNEDLRKIGAMLGVEHILEGSVRKVGTTVRITAQLIQVADGFHMWSATYERELTDIFAIQDEIATEILKQLKAQLLDEVIEDLTSQRTDPEVYELYLLAKQRLYNRTRATIESAVTLLDKAIEKDSNYAPAYAQRAIATMLLSDQSYGTIPNLEAAAQAKLFIDRALELDPQLAEGWASLGLYHNHRATEHEQAIDALSKALSINPNLIDASNWLQIALGGSGDPLAAMHILEGMAQKDPLYRPTFGNSVTTFNLFGREDQARALIARFREYEPDNPQVLRAEAVTDYFSGNAAAGLRLATRAYELAPTDATMHFNFSLGLALTHQPERIVAEGDEFFRVDALDILGRRDEAFELAYRLAGDGIVGNLFTLLNRADRSQELVDYLEERWTGLDAFATAHPHDDFGYGVMMDIAFAYSRTGNAERFEDALLLVENAMSTLASQGVDNMVNMSQNATYLALAGREEEAITQMEEAVERGLLGNPALDWTQPIFASMADNPRFIALRTLIADKVNEQREILGLDPIDRMAAL
ncbi:MAG: hypothetical protein IIB76_08635 [Proteobacteria bacterium]|nr:hypothetical protein [Pseudomonadota bacterium]